MRPNVLAAVAIAFVLLLFGTSAGAQELKLFGGGHFQGSGKSLADAFSTKTGIAATYTPGNTGAGGMARRLDAGELIDVIVMIRDDMYRQVEAGLIKQDSVVVFARDRMALAVKKGTPKPDISTPEKLRSVLLAARAVGMQQPDPTRPGVNSGVNIVEILTNLGILDEIRKKAVIITDPASALVDGKVDISFWTYPELVTRTDVDVVGRVPAALGGFMELAVGVLTRNQNDADARAFIRFLTSADGAAVWTKTGLESLPRP